MAGVTSLRPEVDRGLDAARALVALGVPVFVAPAWPDAPGNKPPFHLPFEWQRTEPDAAVVDTWRPGDALCAVMSRELDLIDFDPRSAEGTDPLAILAAAGEMPDIVARADSPSGGEHLFVRSMGTSSRTGVLPGLDIKAGAFNDDKRGFAFIAPTERASKVTGEIVAYRWTQLPPASLDAFPRFTGPALKLAIRIHAGKAGASSPSPPGTSTPAAALYGSVGTGAGLAEHRGPIAEGRRHDALISYAGYLRRRGIGLDIAETLMMHRLQDCAQPPTAHYPVTEREALDKLHDVYRRYARGTPDLEPPIEVVLDADGQRVNPFREHLLDETGVMSMKRPECLIADTFDRGTVAVVSSRYGGFKSFMLLDQLLSVAYGLPWHGRAVVQGPVLYVVAEGAWGQGERVRAWKEAHGITDDNGAFHLLRVPAQLGDDQQVADLCELVREFGCVLVVIDTFGKSTRGIEENSNTQVHLAIAALELVRDATPDAAGVVVTAHHSEKNPNEITGRRSSRGAGAIEDDVDTVYHLTKNDDGTATAVRAKRKDGPTEDVFVITAEERGTSLVMTYTDSTAEAVADSKVPVQRRLTERNIQRVRSLLGLGKALDAAEVASRVPCSEPAARGYLRLLVASGEAQLGGDDRHRYYSPAPP